jgi:4-hydroxy-tetrahydrodipicolinate reductase
MRVGVLGASGRMGRLVVEQVQAAEDVELVARVGRAELREGCFGDAEVVVDFSSPEALARALPWVGARALVSGTTGLSADQKAALDAQAGRGPVLWAANFSLGIAILQELVRRAAAALPDADVEIVETHHRRKKDAPSGTALALAEAVERARGPLPRVHGREGAVGERPRAEIGLHAVRGGDVVGDHEVWLLAEGERIGLVHRASSRATFAAGAVRAARFVTGRPPGRYSLHQVLGLE